MQSIGMSMVKFLLGLVDLAATLALVYLILQGLKVL